jgi:ligand-binding sensor domain-containing protein
MRFSFFLFVFLFFFSTSQAQRFSGLGMSSIKNYSAKTYGMHPRNFNILQDKRGIMHFGNEYGLIEYDGNYWQATHLTNGTSGYSIAEDKDGRIFIGCDNELGYLSYDSTGTSQYHSLYDKIPDSEKRPEIFWEVIAENNEVIYFSSSTIFIYRNGKFISIKPTSSNGRFLYAKKIGQAIYVVEEGVGLLILDKDKLSLAEGGHLLKGSNVKALISKDQNTLIVADQNKLSLFDGKHLKPLQGNASTILTSHSISHCIELTDKNILVATRNNGFYILDAEGVILKNINVQNGLQSNEVNYAYLDRYGDLWLALDNGIAYI